MNKETLIMPNDIYLKDYDIYVKPYLTMDDISIIGNKMIAAEDYCDMIIKKDCAILEACVIEPTQLNDIEYDLIKHSGLMDAIYGCIINLDELDNYVKVSTSTSVLLGSFLKEATEMISKAVDNMSDSNQIAELIDKANEIIQKK